ncbi:MAG: zinc-binding alcohol dehydrogenase [Ruminococcus sp.]
MEGKRVIFERPEKAVLESFEVREPRENEVLVKVYYNLISAGTEKAYLSGSENTANKFPTNPGYSSVGYVLKTGSAVKNLKIGDRVFVAYGGHASYNIKKASSVVKIPDTVSFQDAVFTRLASFPLLAIRRARLEIGESVVIVGLGMLGLFGVQLARLAGAMPLIAVGNRDIRREKAKQFGADFVFAPDDPDLSKKIISICEEKNGIKGANVIIETSGSESGLCDSLTYASKHGRILLNGCNRVMTKPVNFYKYVHLKGVSLIGAHDMTRLPYNSAPGNWTPKRDYITILGLMADGRINAKSIFSEYANPEEATQVYDRLLHDRNFPLGVIFDWTAYHTE